MDVRIERLPPEVCNQIAAGEVVERPASVVKELVENGLDAGADQIRVNLEEGGKKLIEVIDNGHGMDAASARLALERHATSKISSADDLFGVATYGFRGEALPSIAAVSRFSLVTRTRAMEAAVQLECEAGRISESRTGAPVGTRVTVADLFFPVPARKKFLKTVNTERNAVLDRLQRLAMAHPEVSFRLEHNGRKLLNLTAGDRESDRVAAVLGVDPESELLQIAAEGSEIGLTGYVTRPQVQRSSSRHIYFFVNRRPVRDKALLQALLKAYESIIPRGRYPAAVLFLEVAPGLVDVNVHPAKEEVRFADQGRLFGLVRRTVAEVLSGYPGPGSDFFVPAGGPEKPVVGRPAAGAGRPWGGSGGSPELPADFYENISGSSGSEKGSRLRKNDYSGPLREAPAPFPGNGYRAEPFPTFSGTEEAEGVSRELPGLGESPEGFFSSLELVGILWESFIILQDENDCYVLDQHAAHERVLFERLKRADPAGAQRLLLPLSVDCTPAEQARADEFKKELEELGFDFEVLGPRSLLLHSLPQLADGIDGARVFLETLADLSSGGAGAGGSGLDGVRARLACRLAVKAGRRLERGEVVRLLRELDQTPNAQTCPHGRPFFFRWSRSEIAKRFQR